LKIELDGLKKNLDCPVGVKRLWRLVEYEEVYLKDYETVPQAM
jgi:hypothetical protein